MSDPLFAPAGPVCSVDGTLVPSMARDCVRLEVEEGVEGLRTLRMHLFACGAGATGPPDRMIWLDGTTLAFGKKLVVSVGPDGNQHRVFDGTISALEAVFADGQPPMVAVFAEDALMRLRMVRRLRSFTRISDADLAREVAEDHGLQAEVDVEGPTYDVVQQLNQSDLAFLRARARLVQAELWCAGRTLHMATRPRRAGAEITLVQSNQLLSVRLCADLAHQRSEVSVTGYDAGLERLVHERAGADVVEAEVSGGRTGARIVAEALGPSATIRVRDTALNGREARAWAEAEMLRRGRCFVNVYGTTRGTPEMVVGSRLRLEDVGAPFDGPGYYTTLVRHTVDLERGLRTTFEAERATVNEGA